MLCCVWRPNRNLYRIPMIDVSFATREMFIIITGSFNVKVSAGVRAQYFSSLEKRT